MHAIICTSKHFTMSKELCYFSVNTVYIYFLVHRKLQQKSFF